MSIRASNYSGPRLNLQRAKIAGKEVLFFDGVCFDHYFEIGNHQWEIDHIELHHQNLTPEVEMERKRNFAKSIIETMPDSDSSRY
jgi:hypothetical protein